MKKVLFIAAHRKDRAPNQRFRFEQYFDFLESNGFKCELSPLILASEDKVFYGRGQYLKKVIIGANATLRRLKDVSRRNQYDIIFIAREAFMLGSIFFEKCFRKSKAKIIYDFDDAIWIDVVSSNNKALAWLKDAGKTSKIIALADLVFAGNPYLENYAKGYNNNVTIIPTTIDTTLYQPKPKQPDKIPVVIGWSGSVSTIEHFTHAIPALQKLKAKYGESVIIKVIGDGTYRHEPLAIKGIPWNYSTEVEDLQDIDIGIMPLPDNEWTWGKCGLKGLQYMALEIPTVMSPVGVNSEIIHDGINGFLADTEDEWVEKISKLIDQAELRKTVGKAGRKTVEEKYSVKSQSERYLQYFRQLLTEA